MVTNYQELPVEKNPFGAGVVYETPKGPFRIGKIGRIGNMIVILFYGVGTNNIPFNIYGYEASGKSLWKIHPSNLVGDFDNDYFTAMSWSYADNALMVQTFHGSYGVVDLANGTFAWKGSVY